MLSVRRLWDPHSGMEDFNWLYFTVEDTDA